MNPSPEPPAESPGVANAFLRAFIADREAGQERALAAYQQQFPGYEAQVARHHARLVDADAVPTEQGRADTVGPYRLLRELGRGGQAVVYLAQDTRLPRRVALKVLRKASLLGTSDRLQRFLGEARTAARLDDPNICPIYEVGEEGDLAFLAMRFVDGSTLAHRIADALKRAAPGILLSTSDGNGRDVGDRAAGDRAPGERAAGERAPVESSRARGQVARLLVMFEAVARSLHVAHEASVVHRDIKPQNLMLTAGSEPVILDFGLSHDDTDAGPDLTMTGDVLGTPAYMSPEQHRGQRCDRRTDVWSLGVTLYEALTLQRPFQAATRAELVQAILHAPVPDPRPRCPWIGRDLKAILDTAIEKQRDRRYSTAAEFADDLRRLRQHEPVAARSAGPLLRLWRWAQRHPVAATALATVGSALVLGLLMFVRMSTQYNSLRAWKSATSALANAEDQPVTALATAAAAARSEPQAEIREFVYRILDRCREVHRIDLGAKNCGAVRCRPSIDRSGTRLVQSTESGMVLEFELPSARLRRCWRAAEKPVVATWSPTGDWLLVADTGGSASRADPATGADLPEFRAAWQLPAERRRVTAIDFAANGDVAALSGEHGLLLLLDQRRPAPPRALAGHSADLAAARFAADGQGLLTMANRNGRTVDGADEVLLWDLRADGLGRSIDLDGHPAMACAWRRDDREFAVGCEHGGVFVFDRRGARTRHLPMPDPVAWVGYGPGGELAAGTLNAILVHHPGQDEPQRFGFLCERSAYSGAFRADGKALAVYVRDHSIHLFDTEPWTAGRVLRPNRDYSDHVLWANDGATLVTEGAGELEIWLPEYRSFLPEYVGLHAGIVRVGFVDDGQRIVAASSDEVCVWQRRDGRLLRRRGFGSPIRALQIASAGDTVLAVVGSGVAQLWHAGRDEPPVPLPDQRGAVRNGAFGADGRLLLTVGDHGAAQLWDATTGRRLRDLVDPTGVRGALQVAAFAPGGTIVATAGEDRIVRVFDLATGNLLHRLDPLASKAAAAADLAATHALAFAPTADRLYATGQDTGVHCWKLGGPPQQIDASLPRGAPNLLAVDPLGRHLLVTQLSLGIQAFYDATSLAPLPTVAAEAKNTNTAACFRADGRFALTASKDGTTRIWALDPPRLHAIIRDDHGAILDACFGPDGDFVLTGAKDGSVRLWPVDVVAAAEEFPRDHPR